MRSACSLIAVVVAYWAVQVCAQELPADGSLVQAQKHLDEATKLESAGKYAEAVPLVERALQVREKTLGPNHPEVAEVLDMLSNLHREQAHYQQAESLIQRALRIREASLGKDHPDVAKSLNILGIVYYFQGLYDRAEPLYRRSLQIREVVFGKNHPIVARSLNNLSALYQAQGRYELAEPLQQRALQIREASLGKNHPEVAQSLSNLAELYREQGLYDHAEPLYRRALQIREAVLGKNHPDVAHLLNQLGIFYYDQGLFDQADLLYRRALLIRETTLGENHPEVAASLNNLGHLYYDQGDYARAEQALLRALRIWEMALGKDHIILANALLNLANIYSIQGSYDRAEPLYQRSLQIRETTLGKNHPEVAQSLNNLAALYKALGFPERAKALCEHALQIREAAFGKNHPSVADSLYNLAEVYRAQGLYDRAAPLFQRTIQILEAALGKNHPAVPESLVGSAQLNLAKGELITALPLLQRAFTVSERRLRGEAVAFSEPRLASFLKLLQAEDQIHYSLLHEHPSEPSVLRLALTTTLLRKARSATEIADTSRAVYRSLGPADRETYQRLRALRTQFSSLSLAGPEKLSPAAYQARLQDLTTRADTLEAELAERSARLRAQRQLPGPDDVIPRVAAALPTDSVLVEIIAYSASPITPPPNTPPAKVPSTPAYLALVLHPSGAIRAADLGPAEAIDSAVRRLRLGLSSPDTDFLPAAQELHRLIFQPLLPLLGTQRRLFISPDSQLNLVPFAALHDGTHFLADTFDISYLTSGKDLLRLPETPVPTRSVVVFADPDFGTTTPNPTAQRGDGTSPPAASTLERSPSLDRFFDDTRAGLADQPWDPLPGTRKEAQVIHKILPQAQLFLGPTATKQSLLAVTLPDILHIATHGFFIGTDTAPPGTRGRTSIGTPDDGGAALLPQDPLLRSGLVLAQTPAKDQPSSDAASNRAQNTLVTALELAGMDLWGTELVVLSACDTGRGEVKRGQGVYGLRRALTVAGAETLVTSLWKVKDATTHELMKTFYEQLKAGHGRAQALGEAMRQMRAQHPHPYYWAPFILIGNDAPLRRLPAPI